MPTAEQLSRLLAFNEAVASRALDGETQHVAQPDACCCLDHARERIAALEAEVKRLRMALEAAKPKRPNYGPTKAWVYEGPPLDIWMADKEATNDDATE